MKVLLNITKDMVTKVVLEMKEDQTCGPSGIVIEMVKAGEGVMLDTVTDFINFLIKEEQIPDNWNKSTIMEL